MSDSAIKCVPHLCVWKSLWLQLHPIKGNQRWQKTHKLSVTPITAHQHPGRREEDIMGWISSVLPVTPSHLLAFNRASWRQSGLGHPTVSVVFSCQFSARTLLPPQLFLADIQTPPALCRSDLCRGRLTDRPGRSLSRWCEWCQCVALAAEKGLKG